MDWATILGVGTAAASGGVFGVLCGAFSSIFKFYQQKQAHKQQLELMDKQIQINSQQGSWTALSESLKSDAAGSDNVPPIINGIKSLSRHVVIVILIFVTYMFFLEILKAFEGENSALTNIFTGEELKEILRYIVYSMVFATSTAVLWLFGERGFAAPGMKNR